MYAPVNEAELSALIRLLEDPDEAVYEPVSKRILEYGDQAIPHLEHVWETTDHTDQQVRVETIIRRIQFLEISDKLNDWRNQERADLWEGLLILDKLHHREDRSDVLRTSLEQLRRNAWLELNQYLTPLEQINVLSRVVFEHERFKGIDASRERLAHHFVGEVLLKRTGNQIGLGLLIQVLADKLDLPLYTLSVPGIIVLGSPNMLNPREKKGIDSIDFYLDPQTGELFGRAEIEQYLRRIHQPVDHAFFQPLSDTGVVDFWLGKIGQKADELDETHLATQARELRQS